MTSAQSIDQAETPSAPDPDLSTVGWIGAGRMGAAMAARLLHAGHRVRVYNRTRAKAEALQDKGADVVDSPADLASSPVVFTMVSAGADLENVLFGAGGVLGGEQRPEVVVDSSTVDIEEARALRERAASLGVALLAAPVSGNGKVVTAGKLSIAVSGSEDAFRQVRPLLTAIAPSVTYVGVDELARLVKICHNVFLGVVIQSMAEITVLAEKGGVSRSAFLEFLNGSVMGSTFSRYKTPALVNLDFTPTFTPVLLRKDFDLGLAASRRLEAPMPVAALVHQLVSSAVGHGHRENDFAVLLQLQAAAAGLELQPEGKDVDDGLSAERER
ncbi:MAG TPA: NAD(P)-dependent oxidoreductase [Nakamurella sp.]|nr:NAD(P)-dependent oxidoreductase [Nakamurella sp.]